MPPAKDRIGRRRFLTGSLGALPLATLGLVAGATGDAGATAPAEILYGPKFFNAEEWAFIHAVVDRLIPPDEAGPGAVEAGVPEFIDRQMDTPYAQGALWYLQGPFFEAVPELGYQYKFTPRDIYRIGIAALNRWVRAQDDKAFAELAPERQDEILAQMEDAKLELPEIPAALVFGILLENTKEGYFSDPIHGGNKNLGGWKMIGFPGARADFMDWVDQYGKAYPLHPVGISGQRG
jgi:gluconate 2-dehydrogenase gamma chain